MAVTKCNCLPYPQNATPAQKCMRVSGALVAITTFVVGLLGLLTSLNLLTTVLGPIGTIGSGCMLGGGFLILAALYLTRGKEDKSDLGLGSASQVSGGGPNAQFVPRARMIASKMGITDLGGRLHENNKGKPIDISLEPAANVHSAAYDAAMELLFMTEQQFLSLPLNRVGSETDPSRNIFLEVLTYRFHSSTPTPTPPDQIRLKELTLADIPFMPTEQIIAKIRNNTFPNQAFFCLTPEQVNNIFKEIYSHQPMDIDLLRKIGPHLFPSYPIGKYADAHMKKVFKGIDVTWRSACLTIYVDPRVRIALENDLNRSR